MVRVRKQVHGTARLAAVVGREEAAAASPRPPHAAAGAGKPPGAVAASDQVGGPAAAYPEEVRPEGGRFDKGGGKAFFVCPRYRIGIRVTEKTGEKSAVRCQVRVFGKSAALVAGRVSLPPLKCRHSSDGVVALAESLVGGEPLNQAQVLVRGRGGEEGAFSCSAPRDEGAGNDGCDPQIGRQIEECRDFFQVVAHLGKGDGGARPKSCPGKTPDSRHCPGKCPLSAHEVVAWRASPIEACLDGEPREVKSAQAGHLFIAEEHGVGLYGNFPETERAGKSHELQPVGMTERFAAGKPDPRPAEGGKLANQSAQGLFRYVGRGFGLPRLDPAMAAGEIAGSGDGQGESFGRAEPMLQQQLP